MKFDDIGVFDCRICQLPNIKTVIDYFRWRSEDAHRNALNAHCYWMLRKKGKDNTTVIVERNELKIDYDLPKRDEYSEFIENRLKELKKQKIENGSLNDETRIYPVDFFF